MRVSGPLGLPFPFLSASALFLDGFTISEFRSLLKAFRRPYRRNAVEPNHKPQPFQGYYFRLLKGEGGAGRGSQLYRGGEDDRRVWLPGLSGEYRSSGVMTFIVNQDDIVYEKDLGLRIAEIAKTLTQDDGDSTWRKVD